MRIPNRSLRLEKFMKDPSRMKDIENISAVIKSYNSGEIEHTPGSFYLFVDKKRLSGPLPNKHEGKHRSLPLSVASLPCRSICLIYLLI